jgi:hypothetical protein
MTAGERTADRSGTIIAMAAALLCLTPFAFAGLPEMRDIANHMARIHILIEGAANPDLARGYAIHWRWIGNLGVDLPAIALGRIIGVEQAVILLSAMIAPLTLIGLWMLSRAAYGRFTGMAALALPLILSQMFLWGFLNFSLSVALAMIVAACWLRQPPDGAVGAIGFGLAAVIVWTGHAMGWGGLVLMIVGIELGATISGAGGGWRGIPRRILIGLPLLLPLIPMALWRAPDSAPLFQFDSGWAVTKLMNFATILRGTYKPLDLAMTGLIALAAIAALARVRRVDPRLGGAAAMLILGVLLLPPTVMGSWGADIRMTPWAVMIALIAIPPGERRIEGVLTGAGIAMFLIRLMIICANWQAQYARHAPQLALIDQAPRGSRLAFAYLSGACGTPWSILPDRQLGSMAIVRRDTTTNTMFWIKGADLVEMARPSDRGQWTNGSQQIELADCPSGRIDPARAAAPLAAMARDFDGIWIVADPEIRFSALPLPHGMAPRGAAPGSLLLLRASPKVDSGLSNP